MHFRRHITKKLPSNELFVPLLVVRLYYPESSYFIYLFSSHLIRQSNWFILMFVHGIIYILYTEGNVRFEKLHSTHACVYAVFIHLLKCNSAYKLYRTYTFNVIRSGANALITFSRACVLLSNSIWQQLFICNNGIFSCVIRT